MQARIQRWGNSLAVRIPRSFALESRMEQDTLVDMSLQDGKLVISPVMPAWTLEQLLVQVTPDNLHSELESGPAQGREAW